MKFRQANVTRNCRFAGIDAPICQDIPLGGTRDGLARAEVCHDTVEDLAGEEAFETPDDLASGPTVRGPSRDVVEGRLVVPHADDDGAIEGRIGLSVPASIEAVPAGGDPRRSGDGTRATEFRNGGFRANPVGVIAEEDQHRRRGIGPHPEARSEGGRRRGGESREVRLVRRDFFGQGGPAADVAPVGDDRQINSEDRRSVRLRVRSPRTGTYRYHETTPTGAGMMLTVNLLRAARSCPVKSTLPIVLSRRTSPHPIQRTRGGGAGGGEPTAGGVD